MSALCVYLDNGKRLLIGQQVPGRVQTAVLIHDESTNHYTIVGYIKDQEALDEFIKDVPREP
jgi:hypothetical protein